MNCLTCDALLNEHDDQTWRLWPGWICGGCGAVMTAEKKDDKETLRLCDVADVYCKVTDELPVSLEQIREKFPTANYAPNLYCKRCKGIGVDDGARHRAAQTQFFRSDVDYPCICIFVAHEDCDFAADLLNETVRKMRDGLEQKE